MRPIVVSVGPLATAAANNICTTQTPATANGVLALNGSLATGTFVGTASITTNILTVTVSTSGVLSVGDRVSGAGVLDGTVVQATLTGTGGNGTYILNQSQTFSSGTVYGNRVATLDLARRVLFTTVSDESGKTITVTGTNIAGAAITETVTGPNATTGYTVQSFKTVTSIAASAAFTGAVTVGTNTIADSAWVRFDSYAPSNISIQCTVSGTVNYTVQTTLDDPNSSTNPVAPASVTWVSTSDASVVGATTTQQSNFLFSPLFARVLLNSGTGTVTATFLQSSNGPF